MPESERRQSNLKIDGGYLKIAVRGGEGLGLTTQEVAWLPEWQVARAEWEGGDWGEGGG